MGLKKEKSRLWNCLKKLVGWVDEGLVGDNDEELVGEVLQGAVHDESGLKIDDVEVNLNLVDNQVEGE